MTQRYIFLFAFLFISASAFSQTEIEIKDVRDHIGDSVMIDAQIQGGIFLENVKGSPTFLNVGGEYPNAPLTLVIWKETRSQFFRGQPEKYLKGKSCLIFGKLVLYKGKPEIVIHSSAQIVEPVKVDVPGNQ